MVLYAFSGLGAALLWTKCTISKKKALGFGDIAEALIPRSKPLQYLFQFAAFVSIGAIVGVAFTGPSTILQAIAGGVAWSRLVTSE
jgi:hypothetical protein